MTHTQTKALHICVLTSVHQPFDGRIFHRECVALAQAGYRVTLIAPADFAQKEAEGVTIIGLPKPRNRRGRPAVWLRLLKQAIAQKPDVVHFHDPELLLIVPFLRLRLGQKVKIVYDVHEYFVDAVAGKYWIPTKLRPLITASVKWLERLLIRGVDGLVLVIEAQKRLYPYFTGPVAVVRNLPFASLFTNPVPNPALNVSGLRLIYVGLILPKRGIDILLEAMRQVKEQGAKDITLFLIGPDTSPVYTQNIKTFIKSHNLQAQIKLLGYIPHSELKNYLANADVGMAPGLQNRQYSNPSIATKLFEYMLAGLPIISADHPHRRIYLDESACGLSVPAEDSLAWASAILWLKDNPAEAKAMGLRGQKMVLDHYTWEQEQGCLLAFYDKLLNGAKD